MSSRGQANPFFTPIQIPACGLWLDGADPNGNNVLPAVGTSISRWNDKSGVGANGNVVGTTPTFASGGGITFSRAGAYNTSYSASLTNESLFIVFIYTTPNAQQAIVAQTANGGRTITINAGVSTAALESSVYNVAFGAVSPSTTVPQNIIGMAELITTNSTMAIFYNGTSFGTPTTVSITPGITSVIGGAYNAGSPVSAQYFGGTIFEVVGYTVSLNTSQRQQVEGYLAWKWGLQGSLPANHPYKSSPIPPLLSPPTTLPLSITNSFFTPTQIPGCGLWLDATDVNSFTFSGSNITRWRDKSSNAFSGIAYNLPTYTRNSINNLPTISFNGTSQYIDYGNVLNLGTSSLYTFSVVKYDSTADGSVIAKSSFRANAGRWGLFRSGNAMIYFIDQNASGNILTSYGDTSITTQLISGYWNRFNIYLYQNGSLRGTAAGIWAPSLSNTDPLYVAGYPNSTGTGPQPGFYLPGKIGEIIIYIGSLSQQQFQQVEGYLAWKWGLQGSLPATHPYKSSPIAPLVNPPSSLPLIVSRRWQPNQILSLNAWFDGADPNGNGSIPRQNTAISTWVNKSGGTNATAVGTGALFSSNGMIFATPKYYTTSISYSSNYSIFLVATNNTVGQCYFFARNSIGGGRGPTFTQGYGTSIRLQFYEGTGGVFPIIAESPSDPFLTSIDFSSLSYLNTYYNGVNTSNIIPTATYNPAPWDTIGQAGAGVNTAYYNGTMKELLFFNSVLSTQQRQQVEGYLAWKWGLQGNLPANHPFAKWPPSP